MTAPTVADYFDTVRRVAVAAGAPPVARTIAAEIRGRPGRAPTGSGVLTIAIEPAAEDRVWFTVGREGLGTLGATHARHLYAWFSHLTRDRGDTPLGAFRRRRPVRPAFRWQRPIFDLYFTQSCRTVAGMDREAYVRGMAAHGFTHLEVNGLAFPQPIEPETRGELYPRFYTYCPALDQFVSSFLNRGFYPRDYLAANLARLRKDAALARRFGLTPALVCFEPRSVPDALLEKYPELRGARVDHPFRSFRPRYNLAVSHPVVKRHYREMMQKMMRAVPELGCLAVWTNDSGAGMEYTRSLYVGANGSAYLVREWSDEDVFARSAAQNALGFLTLLRDAAREVNPEFRVTTRLEPFGAERPHLMAGLGEGVDVETPTLLAEGWDSPYRHPRYEDSTIGPFTIFNNRFLPEERRPMRALARRDCRTHVMHAHGPVNNFEPLLGIPAPWLTHEKLAALHEVGTPHLAHLGGMAPPESVPWQLNERIAGRFQFDPGLDIDATVAETAREWAGRRQAGALVKAWRLTDRAIRGFMPNPLYFLWGPWYRIFTRPLVPDIEAIPEKERAYYERHMLSSHHNPTRVDLSRDVLFHLMDSATAAKAVTRIRRHALPPLDRAVAGLAARLEMADAPPILRDQHDRLQALRCWMRTRLSVAVWIADVHGYLETKSAAKRRGCRERLRTMVRDEIANAERLLALWQTSRTVFMAVSTDSETTFIHDKSFGRHLKRKIRLMRDYGHVAPRIDRDIVWRVQGLETEKADT